MFKKILIWSDFSFLWILYIQVDFADTSIVITEPYFNFSSIQESMNEILFEEYQFQSALRINGSSLGNCKTTRKVLSIGRYIFICPSIFYISMDVGPSFKIFS